MFKIYTAFLGIIGFLFGLTAWFVVPIALCFTKKSDSNLPKFFSWYDTPDEINLIGLYEHQVLWVYNKFGWFMACWYWFGIRNRGHGFYSFFSRNDQPFWIKKQWWRLQFTFGWQPYASKKYPNGVEYRPRIAIKTRNPV